MENKHYVVIAYRWGNPSNHSYLVGLFSNKSLAIKCADLHSAYRGGKYDCSVEEIVMNEFENEADYYSKEIYKTP